MNETTPLSNIRIVLSHPSHPGNIGAAARAMKTMGLGRIYLVNPVPFETGEARAMSTSGLDVLDRAVVCASLDDALQGTAIAVAFSARGRFLSHPPATARAAAAGAVRDAQDAEVAMVFGNETSGLSNEEVMKCNRLAHIPADPGYSSLNIAAAVQVVCYELRLAAMDPVAGARVLHGDPAAGEGTPASFEEVENFYEHLERTLHGSGFLQPAYPRRLMERLRRLFGRARLEREEVSILRGILTSLAPDRGGKPGPKPVAESSGKK
ncbi:MAG: RNA methyltransferase [Betaproteobacteria bacterium]|nr:RNA methyltransferase [Betaproteobacteria bacterium]